MNLGSSKTTLRLFLGLILVASMLFIPAGSLRFWQGWSFMALLSVLSITSFRLAILNTASAPASGSSPFVW